MKPEKRHLITCIALVLVFAILATTCYFGPKATYSNAERRALASFPTLNAKTIASGAFMEQFETYAADTFPLREVFRSIKASVTLATGQKTTNDIYYHQGYLSKLEYPLNEGSLLQATETFEKIYKNYLAEANAKVYVSVIPDKNAALADDAGQLMIDYEQLENIVAANTSDFATYIQISDLLTAEDYYRTDSHWRQEQIVDVAERLAAAMGSDNVSSIYNGTLSSEDFKGIYAGQFALPVEGEPLYYLTNEVIQQLKVYDKENQQEIPVYDLAKTEGQDPYEMYLSGPLSLITIENPNWSDTHSDKTSNKELVIFRDSYASAIAPLLATGYEKVTLVDIRYLPSSLIGNYVSFTDCDVLFFYSTSVLNNSETFK